MLEREEGDVDLHFQLMGALRFDPASNTPRFAGCWHFTLAFTLKASWLPSGSNSTGWVLQRSAEDQCLWSLVICKIQHIIRNNFKLWCRIAKLPSCNSLYHIGLGRFSWMVFSDIGNSRLCPQATVTALKSAPRKGETVKHWQFTFLGFFLCKSGPLMRVNYL